ncbi:MAG: CopG family transcriptional regulator [Anaerolineae bacterium]
MGQMVRKQIYLTPHQEALLKRLARERGMAEAEIIRQAVEQRGALVPFRPDLKAWEQERKFLERLLQQGPVAGKRAWRREDLYEQ